MRWTAPPFGWTCYPCFALRMLARSLELCIGDHTDTNNPFHWHHVQFNLPCTTGYDTSLPHVWLIHFDGEVGLRYVVLFDYGRAYGLRTERVQYF